MLIRYCTYADSAYRLVMLERLRTLLIVIEEGSVNRAAIRLRITQPALSRQVKWLETEFGGRLLERESTGVKPTGLGLVLIKEIRPVIASYDSALAEVRREARGLKSEVRVGFIMSAAQSILSPAMQKLRTSHPDLKLKLSDMSPREQVDALKAGDIDVALTGQEGLIASRDFRSLKLRSFSVCAALASADPLTGQRRIAMSQLKDRGFIGIDEDQMPGRNRWMTTLCRAAGFRPRFLAVTDGISHVLSLVSSEAAVTLLPDYFMGSSHPGITFVPLSDLKAKWDCIILWQRGKTPPGTLALIEALKEYGR